MAATRPVSPRRTSHRLARDTGQAVVELAILLPGLLALFGVSVDVARVFGSWMELQSITRDTAEALATDPDIVSSADARTAAIARVCPALAGDETCAGGLVRVADPVVVGVPGTTIRPIFRVTVAVERDVPSIFIGFLVRSITGSDTWHLRSSVTYEIWRGRL